MFCKIMVVVVKTKSQSAPSSGDSLMFPIQAWVLLLVESSCRLALKTAATSILRGVHDVRSSWNQVGHKSNRQALFIQSLSNLFLFILKCVCGIQVNYQPLHQHPFPHPLAEPPIHQLYTNYML